MGYKSRAMNWLLENNLTYYADCNLIPKLNIDKIDNALNALETTLETLKSKLIDFEEELKFSKELINKPFEFEQKLYDLLQRQTELNTKIELDSLKQDDVVIESTESEERKEENAQIIELDNDMEIGA